MSDKAAALLASYGFLATTQSIPEVVATSADGGQVSWWRTELDAISAGQSQPLVFKGQQRKLSLEEMDLYDRHVGAAEEVDEDFFGNFS